LPLTKNDVSFTRILVPLLALQFLHSTCVEGPYLLGSNSQNIRKMRKINVEIRPLKRLAVSGLVGLSSIGASQAAISVNGADLLTEPGASFSVSSNFTPAGTSLSYIGSGTNGSVIGVIPDPSSGVSGVGDTYSITVDVTQVSADTDFGWAVTDGVNVWGMLTYDVGSSLASGFCYDT